MYREDQSDFDYLSTNHGVSSVVYIILRVLVTFALQFTAEMVDSLYDCAKFRYECGNYSEAAEYLYFYRLLVNECTPFAPTFTWHFLVQAPPEHKDLMSAKWGKLSCSILAQDWDSALEELNKLKRDIDESVCTE